MKKFDMKSLRGFAFGVLFTVLISTMVIPAMAATVKEIKVAIGGIKIYVDGELKTPTDSNGNVVEPLSYDGRIYVPLGAMVNMLTDKPASWNGDTQSVYIGKAPVAESTPLDQIKQYAGYMSIWTDSDAQFQILNKTHSPFNKLKYSTMFKDGLGGYATYIIDSDYSSINGMFVVPYTSLGSTSSATLNIYSVDSYGNETLLDTYTTQAGDEPVSVKTKLLGVNILKIKMSITGCFYDIALTGVN